MGGAGKAKQSDPCVKTTSSNRAAMAPIVNAPVATAVTPATARNIGQDTANAVKEQQLARSRLQGIRSTWAAFGDQRGGKSATLG